MLMVINVDGERPPLGGELRQAAGAVGTAPETLTGCSASGGLA